MKQPGWQLTLFVKGASMKRVIALLAVALSLLILRPAVAGKAPVLTVTSFPAGADIFVDGVNSGRTPATLNMTLGIHSVALQAGTGWDNFVTTLNIVAGQNSLNATLHPSPSPVPGSMVGGGATIDQTTVYAPMFGAQGLTTSEDSVQVPISLAGTLSNLRVKFGVALGAGESIVVTVRVNSTDTAVECTVNQLTSGCNDLVNTATFATGDLISVQAAPSGVSASSNSFWWTATYTP